MSGKFIYPPPNSESVVETYNYIDSVDVSWETTGVDSSGTYLAIWYYLTDEPWALGYNESVSANGSKTVNLNIIDGGYYGQFNYYFNDTVAFLSVFFNVDHNTTQNPVTWTDSGSTTVISSAVSSSTSTSSSSSTQSTSSATVTTTSSTTSATSSNTSSSTTTSATATSSTALDGSQNINSSSQSSGISKGATAGIAVGATLGGVALLAIGIYFFFFRQRKHTADGRTAYEIGDSARAGSASSSPGPLEFQGGQSQTASEKFPRQEKMGSMPDTHYDFHSAQLPQPSPYAELAGSRALQELPG